MRKKKSAVKLLTLISLIPEEVEINVEIKVAKSINVKAGILWKKLVHNSNKRGVKGLKKPKRPINVDCGFFSVSVTSRLLER